MSYKKMLLLFSIVLIVVCAIFLSFSYAFYVGTSNQNTSFNASTPKTPIDVVFTQSSTLNMTAGYPIDASDVATEASKINFTVYYPNTLSGRSVAIRIILKDIDIDSILKDPSFKYQLLNGTSVVSSGNFSSLEGDLIVLMDLTNKTSLSKPTTESYELRIWLEEICSDKTDETTCSDYSAWQTAHSNGTDSYEYNSSLSTLYGQNRLIGKTFKAKVKVNSIVR